VAFATVDSGGRDTIVACSHRRAPSSSSGFAEDEALIPYPKTVYPGFRLLQEYFTLPQKFAFFDVTGLEALPADKVDDRFAILSSSRTRCRPGRA
jgi:type VI secretion system protein ImpG